MKIGGPKPWSVIAISEMCKTHWQMAPYERRCNSPFEGPNNPFGPEVNIFLKHHQKTKVECISLAQRSFLGMFIGYALNMGGRSWTGDFLIVDTEDLQPIPPSERHVKKVQNQKK